MDYLSPNYVWIDYSSDIRYFLNHFQETEMLETDELKRRLNELFQDEYESIFIPAGRSLITLLTSQLNYLFATMDDEQKRSIDLCTQKYIERILKIRPLFENGIEGLMNQKQNTLDAVWDFNALNQIVEQSKAVLKGNYVYRDNEERLYIDEQHFVKINFTSSGQQETVWILNILQHVLLNNTKAFIILEEPEAHLYPQAQKELVEILALIANKSCGMLLTTHSPYILGALNNLIYAGHLAARDDIRERVIGEVGKELHIETCNAYYLENGEIQPCTEPEEEGGLIINEVIDGASSEINGQYDRLFDDKSVQMSCFLVSH